MSLDLENISDIFQVGITWLIDDSLFYRVSIHQTLLGNIKTKPMKGVLIIFIPKNGNLILKTIDSNIWKQQKRLSQLARWKAAEEIFNFLKIIPGEERPDQLILLRKTLSEPLEIQLIEFPSILIRCSGFKISFESLLGIKKINEKISDKSKSETFFFNLYDDWIKNISPFTAFSRLVLILKGLEINQEKVKKVLGFSKDFSHETNFWPFFTDEEWVKNEIFLKDLVLEGFSLKNKIDPESLFETEIRDIVFGCYKKENVEFSSNEKNVSQNISFSNISGKKMKTVITSKNWKNYMELVFLKDDLDNFNKKLRLLKKIELKRGKFVENSTCYIFPKNLLKKLFFNFTKSPTNIFMIFGNLSRLHPSIIEIRVLILIPIEKKTFSLILSRCIRNLKILGYLDFLGYLVKNQKRKIFQDFFNYFSKNFQSSINKIFSHISLILIYLNSSKNKVQLRCSEYKKGMLIHVDVSILLTKKIFGFLLDLLKINKLF
jgi:pre-mRNA-processing factor 8